LQEEIEMLGANMNMYTTRESIVIQVNTLARNYEATLAVVEEVLTQPRWDLEEFGRIKTATINRVKRSSANPNAVAGRVFNKLLYGQDHIFAYPTSGTVASIEAISMEDVKAFYAANFSPSVSKFHIVGQIEKAKAMAGLRALEKNWAAKEVSIPAYPIANNRDKSSVYFVDIPGSKQSVIQIGNISMARDDADFYSAEVMNYALGGAFNGVVNTILREEKGYTYGARTGFGGSKIPGTFRATSSVRTNTTGESVSIFRDEINKYKDGISQEDLDFTKNALIKSNARRFETQFALLGMLQEMSTYGLDSNYIEGEETTVRNMTLDSHKALANKYLDPSKMAYLIVGDAESQYTQFRDMGFDEVLLLDKEGEEVKLEEVKQ
ncbi:MAG: zinc protease, partial [Patiriisocius sp.]